MWSAVRQSSLLQRANYVPVLIIMLNEFRSDRFNSHYEFVCRRLREENDPAAGIRGMSAEAREAVYDVAYYFQTLGTLAQLGILEERQVVAVMHHRIIRVWESLEPYVSVERADNDDTGPHLLSSLQGFAKRALRMDPAEVFRYIDHER